MIDIVSLYQHKISMYLTSIWLYARREEKSILEQIQGDAKPRILDPDVLFDMEAVRAEQTNLVYNNDYDSLLTIKNVDIKKFNRIRKLDNMLTIWINKLVFLYFKRSIGCNRIINDKILYGKIIEEKEFNKENLMKMAEMEKNINYDRRAFRQEFKNPVKVEKNRFENIDLLQKQFKLIETGEYTFKAELKYIGEEFDREKNRYDLLGINRYVMQHSNTNNYIVFFKKNTSVKLDIEENCWNIIYKGEANIEEQIDLLFLYNDKEVILWKDLGIRKEKKKIEIKPNENNNIVINNQ